MPTTQAALAFFGGSSFLLLLIAGLTLSLGLGAYTWRRSRSASAHYTWLGAASLLACFALWAAFSGLFHLGHLDPRLWVAPFDRLLLVITLVALGWTLTAGEHRARRWRTFLIGGLAATLLAYAGWAPIWARELHRDPMLTHDPTGMARAWDLWLVALALAVGFCLLRCVPRAPTWLAAAFAGVAIGSMLEVVAPVSPVVPVWSRLGTLMAVTVFVGAALFQALELHSDSPFARLRVLGGRRVAGGPPGEGMPGASEPDPVPDLDLDLGPDVLATQTLLSMAEYVGAEPAFTCLLTQDGDFDVRVLAERRGEPRRLGSLPLADNPTLARTLNEGRLVLRSSDLAPDLGRLYGLATPAGNGPVLLQRIGTARPLGVLVAGRAKGQWEPAQQARLASLARRVAAAIEAGEARQQANGGETARAMTALEAQATALTRLTRLVEGLTRRVDALETTPAAGDERDAGGAPIAVSRSEQEEGVRGHITAPPPGVLAAAAAAAAAITRSDPAAPEPTQPIAAPTVTPPQPDAGEGTPALGTLGERVPRYERALERLPWGVIVVDSAERVAFANPAAARLLHVREISPGAAFAFAFPNAERMELALHRVRRQAETGAASTAPSPDDEPPVTVRFDTPALQVDLAPLRDPAVGFLGAVAVLRTQEPSSSAAGVDLVPLLTEALRAPMTSILGYSDLLTRGPGVTEEQLGRFLQRIDANLARMQVMLNNLLTVIALERAPIRPEPVDVEQAVQNGVIRARAQFEEKALDVNYDFDTPLPNASADPSDLTQIIDNLLVNAALRSPQGGDVTVGVAVRADADSRVIVISVHDRGSQLGGTVTGVIEIDETVSAPVALRIVRLLASRQGGRAWAESDPLGARFFVRLPVRRAA